MKVLAPRHARWLDKSTWIKAC